MKIVHVTDYREKRKFEYPALSELADALYWNSQGDGSHLREYLARVHDVKQRYPKTEGGE
jgi:hypothetical protein